MKSVRSEAAAYATDKIRSLLPAPAVMERSVRFTLDFGKLGAELWGAEFVFRPRPEADTMTFATSSWCSNPEKAIKLLIREVNKAAQGTRGVTICLEFTKAGCDAEAKICRRAGRRPTNRD